MYWKAERENDVTIQVARKKKSTRNFQLPSTADTASGQVGRSKIHSVGRLRRVLGMRQSNIVEKIIDLQLKRIALGAFELANDIVNTV